jgi:1-acyl-sn-glycerol-3-phosphate acyltransferase
MGTQTLSEDRRENLLPNDPNPILSDPRNNKRYVFHITLFRRIALGIMRFLFWIFADTQASGTENIIPDGPMVLAPNHLSNYEIFPIQFNVSRPIFAMAKSALHKNPILDLILRQLGSFPVYRGQRDEWAIRHAEKVLEKGLVLGMFPEGTRSKGAGLRAAKTGAARLAIKAQCPIVPLAVDGTQRMFKNFPRRTQVTITIGEPIYPRPDETPLALTDRLMFTLADMLPPDLRGVYAERPVGFED